MMDCSAEAEDATVFTAAQTAALKHSSGGARIALTYVSTREAEDCRFYWQNGWELGAPACLAGRRES